MTYSYESLPIVNSVELEIFRKQKKREQQYLIQAIKEIELKIRLRKRDVERVVKTRQQV